MCRILVDCDDNTQSRYVVEEEPPEKDVGPYVAHMKHRRKKSGKVPRAMETPPVITGTGTVAVAYCWRDIVLSEVSKVRLHV